MAKIIRTKDKVNGDPRNYAILKYVKRVPSGYIGRTASGYPMKVATKDVQEIRVV